MENATGRDRYSLRWNNYMNNIAQVFDEHLQKGMLVDVTLSCEGQFIKAHKLILSACSDYFREMFEKLDTPNHPVIVFHNIKLNNLKNLVKFIYHGEIKVLDTEIQDLLMLGDTLRVKGLSSIKVKKPEESKQASSSPKGSISSPPLRPQENESNMHPPPLVKFVDKDTNTTNASTINAGSFRIFSSAEIPKLVIAPGYPITVAGSLKPILPKPTSCPVAKITSIRTSTDKNVQVSTANQTSDGGSPMSILKPYSERIKAMKLTNVSGKSVLKQKTNPPQNTSQVSSNSTSYASDAPVSKTVRIRDFALESPGVPESKKKKLAEQDSPRTLSPVSTIQSDSDTRQHDTRQQKNIKGVFLNKKDKSHVISLNLSESSKGTLATSNNASPAELSGSTGETLARPPNAFMIFANEWRKKLSIEYPNENCREISYRLGNMWKAMSVETKNTYYKAAQDAAEEYKQKCAQAEKSKPTDGKTPFSPKSPVIDAVQLVKLVMNTQETDDSQESDSNEQTVFIKEEEPDIENHEVGEESSDKSYKDMGE